jgi:ATP-binding protein involved in chromosome partitioning
MVSSALRQFVNDTDWGELDYLILDLPPGTGDVHLTMLQIVPLTGVVMVTTPQAIALADAYKAATMFGMTPVKVPILGIIENMSYFTPEELPENKYYLFGNGGGKSMAIELKVPFLGEVPIIMSVREGGDRGIPGAVNDVIVQKVFRELAEKVAQKIAVLNAAETNS